MSGWKIRNASALALVVVVIPLAGADSKPDSAKQTGMLVGRVVDLEGKPVAGANVWVGENRNVRERAKSGPDGRFRLGPVSDEHPVMIWAEDADRGFAREHWADVAVFAGREVDLGDMALAPGARISVRVVDAQGKPVAGAKAAILSWRHVLGHTITQNGPDWTASGDAQGFLRTPPLPVGKTDLTITAPGRARRRLDRRIAPGETAIDLGDVRLEDEQPLSGIVVDQDGKPVANAEVAVDFDYEHPIVTGNDGTFVARDAELVDTSYIAVSAAGYFDPLPGRLHEFKGQRTGIKLELQKAYTVRGSVVDAETGKLVPFDTVQLCLVERNDDGTVTLTG